MDSRKQELLKRVEALRPIDDTFFEVLADDVDTCQEILRVILEDPKLVVEKVEVQKDLKNLYGRSVRLDALATLGNGTLTCIEVQRDDKDDHLKRVRYNMSSVTIKNTATGTSFKDVPNVISVFISQFDPFDEKRTIYHIDKIIRESGKLIDDGWKIVFVNTKCNDGTLIAELMQEFEKSDVDNPKFPALTRKFKILKNTEGGKNKMCQIVEEYAQKYAQEYAQEYYQKHHAAAVVEQVLNALKKGRDVETIADITGISVEEVLKLKKEHNIN